MGTLASELIPVVARGEAPRVYADANIPSGAVGFMRTRLGWDVLFVMEHEEFVARATSNTTGWPGSWVGPS